MPRRTTTISFIANKRTRATAFANRKKGILKKARDLATLCRVPVAVVCANPDGGAPEVWVTEEGVLDRYRALPAEKRADHTHLRYYEEKLGKENAKLARVRQDGPAALKPPDAELSEMTLGELHDLLESIDAALRATAERRRALGLPGDDEAGESRGHGVLPRTGGNFVGLEGYQVPAPGNTGINDGRLDPAMRDAFQPYNDDMMQPGHYSIGMTQPGYYNTGMNMMQPACNGPCIGGDGAHMDGYPLEMLGNGNNYHGQLASGAFQPLNAIMQPGYGGFQCTDNSYVGNQMQVPGNGFPDLAMWRTDEPCTFVPAAGYPYMHMSGNCMGTTAAAYPGLITGANFLDMGIGGNFMNYVDGYETGCSSNEFQCSGTSQNSSSIGELHYLSDVADGMHFRYDATQLRLWES